MAQYDILKNLLESRIFTNNTQIINGNYLRQQALEAMIDTLGIGSGYMGLLSNANKPTAAVDGKQFYIGVNNSATAVSVDLSGVGLGTVTLTQSKLWLIWSDNIGWNKRDLAEGIAATIPQRVTDLVDSSNYNTKPRVFTLTGDVVIPKLASNSVYYIKDATDLKVDDYDYSIEDERAFENTPTQLVVLTSVAITVTVPSTWTVRSGDSLSLDGDGLYLITVWGYLWKIEKY